MGSLFEWLWHVVIVGHDYDITPERRLSDSGTYQIHTHYRCKKCGKLRIKVNDPW